MSDTPTLKKAPAFQFYPADFIADTTDMTAEEVGGYIRLLCHQWTTGSIPNDNERLARIAGLMGVPSVCYCLTKFVLCADGMLRNSRLEQIRVDQQAFRAKKSEAGLNGSTKRWSKCQTDSTPIADVWHNHSTPIALPLTNTIANDSSLSPSSIKDNTDAPKSPRVRFQKPTVDELTAEAIKIGLPVTEVDKFLNYYESIGWKIGRNQMKSWPHTLKNWLARIESTAASVAIKATKEIDWRDSL